MVGKNVVVRVHHCAVSLIAAGPQEKQSLAKACRVYCLKNAGEIQKM